MLLRYICEVLSPSESHSVIPLEHLLHSVFAVRSAESAYALALGKEDRMGDCGFCVVVV